MPTKEELIELLEEISNYMIENNCECGPWGSKVYASVDVQLEKLKQIK